MSILETVGALIVGLLLIAAAAFGLYSAFGKSNVATTEQNLVLLRMHDDRRDTRGTSGGITGDAVVRPETVRCNGVA